MDLNLDSFIEEIRQWLNDSDALVWPPEVLSNCLRQALAAVQRVCPLKISIAGLNEATITILSDGMPALLVRLALEHAWQYRLMQHSELFQPETGQPNPAAALLEQESAQLKQALENLRLSYLQSSSVQPFVVWPEDDVFDEPVPD